VTPRIVQAELLDSLPPGDPDARRNRSDLRVINALMGNYRWFVRNLDAYATHRESILEIGAGTGELALGLHRRGWPVDGLDTWPRPEFWPTGALWHQTDLRTFSAYADYNVIYGNLILHQFTAEELAALGSRLKSRARVILACEPERSRTSQWLFSLVAQLLRANYVSRHDGKVSIAAGFHGDELPRLLGLEKSQWSWRCSSTLFGANRMIAWRNYHSAIPV
jgi:hypothetical protein